MRVWESECARGVCAHTDARVQVCGCASVATITGSVAHTGAHTLVCPPPPVVGLDAAGSAGAPSGRIGPVDALLVDKRGLSEHIDGVFVRAARGVQRPPGIHPDIWNSFRSDERLEIGRAYVRTLEEGM